MDQKISRKLNILEIHSSLDYAGGQRNMVTFAKYLRKDIFSVFVATIYKGGPLEAELKKNGIEYFVGNGTAGKVVDVVKQKQIDVIHIHRSGGEVGVETEIIKLSKKINPKLIVIEKNVFGKFDKSLTGDINCSFFQSMMHINERYLISSGEEFDFERHKVLYNHVDDQEFSAYHADQKQIREFREKLGIKENEIVFGKVARPALEKWSDLIIDCVPFLKNEIKNFKIVIIGAPDSRVKRIRRSGYSDHFILLPETNDQASLHLFYQSIDVLAHCSKIGECNGNTINEAFYWKKPVITNSTPRKDNGQLEQVLSGVNGIIANNPFSFSAAMALLANDPVKRAEFGEAGYRQTKRLNDPRGNTAQIEKYLLEKTVETGLEIPLLFAQEYAKIEFIPTKENILKYREEYRKMLGRDFVKTGVLQMLRIWSGAPVRVYWRIRDIVEHKISSYARRK